MFSVITKTTPANHVHKKLQQQHLISTSTITDGGHMFNYIHQNEVNVSNGPLKVKKPFLENSSEMCKLVYTQV